MGNIVSEARDERTEEVLNRWNLKWSLVVDHRLDGLKMIDTAQVRDLKNQKAPERTEQFATQMRNGATFPPVVVWAPDVLIDGNGRYFAARKVGYQTFPAYVVQIPDVKFALMLAAALNQMGGVRLEPAEAYRAAVNMLDMGWSDDAVARELAYSPESVRKWRRAVDVRDRAERLHLGDLTGRLKKTQIQEVGKVTHDEPFAALVRLVVDGRPELPDLKALVEKIGQAASDADAVALIESHRAEWVAIGPPPGRAYRSGPARQLHMYVGGLLSLGEAPLDEMYESTSAEAWLPKLRQASTLIASLVALYEERQSGGVSDAA